MHSGSARSGCAHIDIYHLLVIQTLYFNLSVLPYSDMESEQRVKRFKVRFKDNTFSEA
jgi:hypothetical protein